MLNDKLNKRYANSKPKKNGHAQHTKKPQQAVGPQGLSAANATQQAPISDGHLAALINSHINDGSDPHSKVPTVNDFLNNLRNMSRSS